MCFLISHVHECCCGGRSSSRLVSPRQKPRAPGQLFSKGQVSSATHTTKLALHKGHEPAVGAATLTQTSFSQSHCNDPPPQFSMLQGHQEQSPQPNDTNPSLRAITKTIKANVHSYTGDHFAPLASDLAVSAYFEAPGSLGGMAQAGRRGACSPPNTSSQLSCCNSAAGSSPRARKGRQTQAEAEPPGCLRQINFRQWLARDSLCLQLPR